MRRLITLLFGLLLAGFAQASITVVASTAARNNDTDTDITTTLGAAIQAGDTIVCGVLNRTNESALVSSFSDSVNGSWPAAVAGPTDSVGGSLRSWFYVFENSGAGTPAITVTFDGSITAELTCFALHGTTATPELDVLGTTYNTAGATETNIDTAAVSATAAGALIGAAMFTNFQGSTPTMDGAGESIAPAAGGPSSRGYLLYESVSGAGDVSFEMTAALTRAIVFQATFIEGGGAAPPSITDVDEDDTVTLEQTNVEVDGAAFDTATAEVRQGAETYAVSIDSQDADTIVFDMPTLPGVGPKHGAADLAVINTDDQEDEHPITIAAESGSDYVDLTSVAEGVPRITAVPDLEADDQVQWRNVTGDGEFDETDIEVLADASITWTEGVTAFEIRVWDHTDSTWSDWVEQTIDAAVAGAGPGASIIQWRRRGRR
jgi:hypothetical protein